MEPAQCGTTLRVVSQPQVETLLRSLAALASGNILGFASSLGGGAKFFASHVEFLFLRTSFIHQARGARYSEHAGLM